MKRRILLLFALLLCLVCLLSLTACDEENGTIKNDEPDGLANNGETEHVHAYGKWKVTKEPTCGSEGTQTSACSCGASKSEAIPATGEHTYDTWVETIPATCTADGLKTATCSCAATATETIVAFGEHDWNSWSVDTPARCETAGRKTTSCKRCPETDEEPIAPTGHSWSTANYCPSCQTTYGFTAGLSYERSEDGTYYIVKSLGTASSVTELVIPHYHEGLPVKEIKKDAFKNKTALTRVVLGDNIEIVGNAAFYGCTALTEVDFANVVELKSNAFYSCTSLRAITLPDTLTSIGSSAFSGCTSLASLTCDASLTLIDSFAFNGCSALTEIDLDVQKLMSNAFKNCTSLSSVTLNANAIVQIYGTAFDNTAFASDETNMKNGFLFYEDILLKAPTTTSGSVTIPDGTRIVAANAFYQCKEITAVTMPSSVVILGNAAFQACEKLQTVQLSTGITRLEAYTFSGCTALTSISGTEQLTYIGSSCFNATSLQAFHVGANVTYIGVQAFGNSRNNSFQSMTFANPNGWWRATSSTATGGTNYTVPSDPSAAAQNFRNDYQNHYFRT